ncbi:Dynactin subunit 3 [Mortierella sp. AD094]|nr:Dynactin subunit 3 [Mortierella sp. AD094]
MSSEENQQLQDLESLSQRLRALEKLLAPPPAPKPIITSNETDSPTEEAPEDIVSTLSPSRNHNQHHHHQQHSKHGHHNQPNHTPGSLSRRIQQVEATLWTAVKERKPIDEFLQKYESSKLINNPYGSHSDRELLSLQAKTELILAAQEDLQKLAEESKEIQSLQRCAEIGGLKSVESHYPELSKLETIHIEQFQEANKISDRANKLTDDYNGLINTLSEVFLSWDALLTAAELKVSEAERLRS